MKLATAIALLAAAPCLAAAAEASPAPPDPGAAPGPPSPPSASDIAPIDAPPLAGDPVAWTPSTRVYLAVRGGVYRASHGVETSAPFDEGPDLDVTFGVPLGRHLAAEASVGRYGGRTGRRSIAGGTGPDDPAASLEREVSVIPIAGSIRATARAARLAFSLVAGAGVHVAAAETTVRSPSLGTTRTASRDDRAFGVHVGGGVALAITQRIRVGIELVRTFVSALSLGEGALTVRPDELDLDGFRGGATVAFRM